MCARAESCGTCTGEMSARDACAKNDANTLSRGRGNILLVSGSNPLSPLHKVLGVVVLLMMV